MKTPGWNSSSAIAGLKMTTSRKGQGRRKKRKNTKKRSRHCLPNIPFALSPGGSWVAIGITTALEGESGHEPRDQNPRRSPRVAAPCAAVSCDASRRTDAHADSASTHHQAKLSQPARAHCSGAADAPPRIATDAERSDL